MVLWASSILLSLWEEEAAAAPPDVLPGDLPVAVAGLRLVPPHSGPLEEEVEERQLLAKQCSHHLPPLVWAQGEGPWVW